MVSRWFGCGFCAAIVALLALALRVEAAGPVETNLFAVTGVEVDVTDKDASTAKTRAIIEAQVKAFQMLAERLGSTDGAKRLASLKAQQIGRMLRSLSIEEEHTGPGRYIGKLTIRFLPNKIRALFSDYGIPLVEEQSPTLLVIPVWKAAQGPALWEDNLWRKAWLDLKAEQAIVPVIVPLGDLEDTQSITPEEALAGDEPKLEALMLRYETKAVLVAVAEPDGDAGVHAVMNGQSPLGTITLDKIYTADEGGVEASAALAAKRIHELMVNKWRGVRIKIAAEVRAQAEAKRAAVQASAAQQSIPVTIPFASAGQWNGIRQRLLATPGVIGLDVTTLAGNGAIVRLMFATTVDDVRSALAQSGLKLQQVGGTWVLRVR